MKDIQENNNENVDCTLHSMHVARMSVFFPIQKEIIEKNHNIVITDTKGEDLY